MYIKLPLPYEGKNDHETLENLFSAVTMISKQLEHILNNPQGYFLTGNTNSETEEYNG